MRVDKFGNPYLIWTYTELSVDEKANYFNRLGEAIARHKKAYYLGDNNAVVSDAEYDYLERLYEAVAEDLGLEPVAVNAVGAKLDMGKPVERIGAS